MNAGHCGRTAGARRRHHILDERHLGSVITHVARPRPSARPQSRRVHWSCKRAERVREGRVVGADGDKYKPLDRHAFTTLEVPKGPERGFLTAHSGA